MEMYKGINKLSKVLLSRSDIFITIKSRWSRGSHSDDYEGYFVPSEMSRHIVQYKFNDVSEECTVSAFSIKE
jgi:hypothetical protein